VDHPEVADINQVLGRGFLFQRLDDPICLQCASGGENRQMYFLASLRNDSRESIRLTFDGTQIVFFFCPISPREKEQPGALPSIGNPPEIRPT
jgi:hypothetical protein